ncbi:MAG: glucose-1-phosphate adenylyltransferase [Candidatus Eisenbacteria bacterium]|nr:glucose-1-phosphate adenylyltransferase [Candidatus Eisenbacteria bacterium]
MKSEAVARGPRTRATARARAIATALRQPGGSGKNGEGRRMLSRIKLPQTTAMILAGGRVGELSVLTLERPKSALPFAGHYRIIDFPLSNLCSAGINAVGILSQYRPASLIDHVGVGESWDFVGLDRGAKILPPYSAAEGSDWYRGNADAVYQNLDYLRDRQTELVLVLSGDHIYSMDYRELLVAHLERGAELTVALKAMPPEARDRRFGYATLGMDERVLSYEEKPAEPKSDLVSLTVYVFTFAALEEVLLGMKDHDSIEFGRDVIPAMLARERVYGHRFDGYWAYTRTVDSYFAAHEDLLEGQIDIESWMIRTNNEDNSLARQVPPIFRTWSDVDCSLIGEGSLIDGTVHRSVLGPGVRVGRGATIENSILYNDVVVAPGARIRDAIIDKRTQVGQAATIGIAPPGSDVQGPRVTERGIVLIGKAARITEGTAVPRWGVVPPGARVAPGTAGAA